MTLSTGDPNLQLTNVLIMPTTPCDWTLLHFRLFKYQQACSQPPNNQWVILKMPLIKDRMRFYPSGAGFRAIHMLSPQAGNKSCQIHSCTCQNSIIAYGCNALIRRVFALSSLSVWDKWFKQSLTSSDVFVGHWKARKNANECYLHLHLMWISDKDFLWFT